MSFANIKPEEIFSAIILKVTMLPTEFSVDEEALEPILMENRLVQCVVQVKCEILTILIIFSTTNFIWDLCWAILLPRTR